MRFHYHHWNQFQKCFLMVNIQEWYMTCPYSKKSSIMGILGHFWANFDQKMSSYHFYELIMGFFTVFGAIAIFSEICWWTFFRGNFIIAYQSNIEKRVFGAFLGEFWAKNALVLFLWVNSGVFHRFWGLSYFVWKLLL